MNKFLLTASIAIAMSATGVYAQEAETTVVASADFTIITEGTPETPVAFPSYGSGSFTTLFPNWYNYNGKQAGGQLLIPDGGYIRTPSKDMSGHSGIVRVNARVKMMDSYGGILRLSVGYSSSNSLVISDSEWHDVSIVMSGGSYSSYVRLEPSLSASGVLVQNMTVEQSDAFFVAPEALQPNQADGTSFTAKWKSVKGATGYYLDIYSYTAGGAKDYVINNEALGASVTSKQVTGLDASKKYYYVVRATNGVGVSADSNEIEVIKVIYYLGKPTNLSVSTNGNTFTASWTGDIEAQEYILNLNATRVLAAEEEVALLREDFANIADGTLESIDFIISSNLDPYTKTPGWEGGELGKAAGHMVLSPYGGETGYLNTPKLDLSRNNGHFTVNMHAAVAAFGRFYDGAAEVCLLNADGNVVETHTIDLSGDFSNYNVDFTGGLAECRVSIRYSGDYKLFIDEMDIRQLLPAGAAVTEKVLEATTTDTTYTHTMEAGNYSNTTFSLTVVSAAETVMGTDIVPIYSEASDAAVFTLGEGVGVDEVFDTEIVSRVYYNAAGVASAAASEGFNIEVTEYADGRRVARRIIQRR